MQRAKSIRSTWLNISITSRNDSQEKMGALEAQVKQLGLQAAQDCARLAKDRTLTLQLLHKVGQSLLMSAKGDNNASGYDQYARAGPPF